MTELIDEKSTHNRWKLASQISGLGIWEYTLNEKNRFFSDEWFLLRGLSPEPDVDRIRNMKEWMERVHPDDHARVQELTTRFHDGSTPVLNFEFRELHADGHYIWILSRGQVVEWSADGKPLRFLGTDTDITSTKAAQYANEELRQNELRYKIAIENASVGVWDIDLLTGERFRSDGWKIMRGHAADSAYGSVNSDWQTDVHPDDLDNLLLQGRRFRSSNPEATTSTQYRQRRKDGSWMWVLSRGNVILRDRDGLAVRAIGVDTDVTEIKEKEAILSRVSKTLELAVSASQMGVWESFAESGDAIWDQRTRDIFGYNAVSSVVTPQDFKSCIHPDDIAIVEADCDAPAARGEDFSSSFRVVHPDGSVRHVNVQATYHPTHELGPRHVGIVFDVTDRVTREAALTQSNRLLDGVLHQMEQGIAMFQGADLESSRIILSNDRFYELLELDRSKTGPNLSFADYRAHIDPFLQWPQNGFNNLTEVVDAASKGTGLNTLLRLPSGRVISVTGIGHGSDSRIVTFTDMTALFKSERRREELADNISHLERLQALGKLTGGVAHDFNNLLTVIVGNAELLQDSDDNQAEFLDAILVAAQRGAELTQRLLAFSRKQPLQPTSIATDALLTGLKGLLARTLGGTIAIETRFEPDVWCVHADPGQLENALINLAVNARDAMPNGGNLVISAANETISSTQAMQYSELEPGDYVKFTVLDDGFGMDAKTLEQAFDPFFTTKDVGQGSGLGLSMVFGFIKQSNGDTVIASHPGQWTQVDFLLPKCVQKVRKAQEVTGDENQVGQQQFIVLVEDDPTVRRMVEVTLDRLNYSVTSFANAAEALTALSDPNFNPDLVISDVSLPGGMSGFDIGEQCAAMKPSIKFLYMSGYSEDLLPAHRFDLEKLEFLSKPFSVKTFSKRISDILRREH